MSINLDNPFIKPPSAYTRNIDIVKQYIGDASWFLHKNTGRAIEDCRAFVISQIKPDGPTPLKDPEVLVLEKDETFDRHRTKSTFLKHLKVALDEKAIMSPTLAQYDNPAIHGRSPEASLTITNINARKVIKKQMFEAEAEKNMELYAIRNNQQTSVKLENNAMSGAFTSPFNPIYLKSGHSTLTSICRCAAGFGNANNERLISGNRHYWCYDVTVANITSVITMSDHSKVRAVMDKYNLRYPTVKETQAIVERSRKEYWWSIDYENRLNQFIAKLTDLERAVFLFTGDMWSLANINPDFVRQFITELGQREHEPVDNPDEWLSHVGGNIEAYALLLNEDHIDGRGLKEIKEKDPEVYKRIGGTAKNVMVVLNRYRDMIETFWTTPCVPASLARFPDSIRKSAVTSDTDSTIYTVQEWVEWYTGSLDYTSDARMVWYTTVFISSMSIIDVLARCCKNMGVIDEDLFRLEMKNEFGFPVFVTTSRAKHYFALQSYREGNVFKKPKLERKGVGLRDSTQPIVLMDNVKKLILFILNETLAGNKLSLKELNQHVSFVENNILQTIKDGKPNFLRTGRINSKDAYRQANSKYLFYELWEDVFSEKYGHSEAPPYRSYQLQLNTNTPSSLREWFALNKDEPIISGIEKWYKRTNKSSMQVLELPKALIDASGIPIEVRDQIDGRRLIANNCYAFYLLLEAVGYPLVEKNNNRLFSDFYQPVESSALQLFNDNDDV